MSTHMLPRRALTAAVLAAVVAAAAFDSGTAAAMPTSTTSTSAKAVAFHDDMRALWEAHGTWTERAIVDFVGGLPDTNLVVARLRRNQVAAFLHAANPKHWALPDMRTMMRIHLNQVIAPAVDQLDGHYAAAIRLYGVYIDHIIDMADMLSTGIIEQFPSRF